MKWACCETSARDDAWLPVDVVPPMHPTLMDKVPERPNWLHEIKWDGYRIGVCLGRNICFPRYAKVERSTNIRLSPG